MPDMFPLGNSALCLCYMLLSDGVYIVPQLTCVVRIYEVELR